MLAMLSLFKLIPLKMWGAAILIVAVTSGVIYLRHEAYQAGYAAKTAEVEEANRRAQEAARAGQREVDDCWGKPGRHWDRETGACTTD